VYIVVAVGETDCDPLVPTGAPFSVTETAFVVFHDSIDVPPLVMLVGFAEIVAVGAGAFTVTVAVAVADTPDALVATSVYVVVALGEYDCDPLSATGAPFMVTDVAFVVLHVSVDDCPLVIDVGLADNVAVGAGSVVGAPDTVTVAVAVAETPAALRATNVYVVVVVGEYACDPLSATEAPFIVTDVAFVVLHVSVDDCPLVIVVGLADNVAVGAGVVDVPTVTVAVAVTR
jgi:hypothetical protein